MKDKFKSEKKQLESDLRELKDYMTSKKFSYEKRNQLELLELSMAAHLNMLDLTIKDVL